MESENYWETNNNNDDDNAKIPNSSFSDQQIV